ncbi:MAG TPA: AMMECR1 domain-containing protein [Candidatus Andersenbacteria bacterium]|nr:MAG: hypothetical protein A2854_05130 [Parcubacteria group bacterium RIFCSPHIGHO2_01_FULL_56_18]HLD26031.1 AMMECR1 domain-containing protein [Candidatus Andersenbacteria bacterium]
MHYYAKLAKTVSEHYVKSHQLPLLPLHMPTDLRRQRACFVQIFENPGRRLRAVAGSPLPQRGMLAEEIMSHVITALSSATTRAVRRAELPALVYSIAVLDPLQRISHQDQLEPSAFGLYLNSDQGKSALLLPRRPGIETPQDQIATALRESGINHRQEAVAMYRFAVTYYE